MLMCDFNGEPPLPQFHIFWFRELAKEPTRIRSRDVLVVGERTVMHRQRQKSGQAVLLAHKWAEKESELPQQTSVVSVLISLPYTWRCWMSLVPKETHFLHA